MTSESFSKDAETSVPKPGRPSLPIFSYEISDAPMINLKRNPPVYYDPVPPPTSESKIQHYLFLLSLWKHLQNINGTSLIILGLDNSNFKLLDSKQTVLTHLSSIENPITNYGTIAEMFTRSKQLSKQANIKYTYVALDVGAAVKAYHVKWNQLDKWSKIIIHLGDFHALLDFFGSIGLYVSGGRFEKTLY